MRAEVGLKDSGRTSGGGTTTMQNESRPNTSRHGQKDTAESHVDFRNDGISGVFFRADLAARQYCDTMDRLVLNIGCGCYFGSHAVSGDGPGSIRYSYRCLSQPNLTCGRGVRSLHNDTAGSSEGQSCSTQKGNPSTLVQGLYSSSISRPRVGSPCSTR